MSNDKLAATFHPNRWIGLRSVVDDQWYACIVEDEIVTHIHPIPFADQGEADRGAARLNARDAGITGVPVPPIPEDEARAARQARIAELRGRRQPT